MSDILNYDSTNIVSFIELENNPIMNDLIEESKNNILENLKPIIPNSLKCFICKGTISININFSIKFSI